MNNNMVLLKEIIAADFNENDLFQKEDGFFEYFVASQVLKNYGLDDDELKDGLTGGGNDGGCDGVYLFLNGNLLTPDQIDSLPTTGTSAILNLIIIQSKNTNSFKEDAIMKWKTLSENLFDMEKPLSEFKQRYSEGILEKFQMLRDTMSKLIRKHLKISIEFIYAAIADEIHPNVKAQAEELESINKKIFPSATVEFNFLDANKLMELYNSDIDITINIRLAATPISIGQHKDIVALINVGTYYKFITDSKNDLQKKFFESNVRDYQGKNSVNSAIAKTLRNNSGEDFWWLNNGITILSDETTFANGLELVLTNPKIVNGLQTSTEIYNYYSQNTDKIQSETRNVLVRIISPVDEASRDRIILATNNQTNIPKSSLRVTDDIHLQIEMYFKSRGLYYDRRKNYYKNQRKKSSEIVSVPFLAQCLISLLLKKPDFARARPSTLLTDDGTYQQLYNSNFDLNVYYNTAVIGKRIQKNLSLSANLSSTERNDIQFYVVYSTVAQILKKRKITDKDMRNFNIDLVTDELINSTKDKIYKKYKELGGNSRVAKDSAFINDIDSLFDF